MRGFEEVQRPLVASAGLCDAVEARHGLDVVVQDLGARGDDQLQRFVDALEVRREDLDAAAGGLQADLLDDVDEGLRRADVVVVAVHAGDDGVLEAELRDGVGHAPRLIEVDRLGLALGHRAEAAAPRAEVAEHHEGRGLLVPALADVGAVRALADGVQVQIARQLLERVEGLAHGSAGLQPLGLRRGLARREVDLNQLGYGRRHRLLLYLACGRGGYRASRYHCVVISTGAASAAEWRNLLFYDQPWDARQTADPLASLGMTNL